MLTATAMVVFMVPGLALFYGGLTRSKNVLNMINMNVYCIGIVPVLWVLFSYSLGNSRAEDGGSSLIGNLDAIGLRIDGEAIVGIDLLTVAFLMTFAAITPALISGAVAGRMKFSAWVLFVPLWSVLCYAPVTYWVYTGWHHTELSPAAIDFAGGTAIHINAGVAALVLAIVLGRRRGWPEESMAPHNMTLVILGTGILWFGWFGFNAGSALAANDQAVQALMNTFIAPAAGMLTWLIVEKLRDGHATALGAASGIVAALVAITPAAGFVGTLAAMLIGAVAGVLCYAAIQLKHKLGYDDSLDVVGIHGVGGIVGGLMLGFLAEESVGGAKGGGDLFVSQLAAIGSVIAFSAVVTFIIAMAIKSTIGLRVDEESEQIGLDQTVHSESAYS
ncbi:MAG: ammonium transporter [Acidimicrobiales bacterium]|nr:ammonium transporter [Acidimicrobiales bacterium]